MHIDINDYGPGHVPDITTNKGDSSNIKVEVWKNWWGGVTDPWTDVYMSIYNENDTEVYYDKKRSDEIGNCYFDTPSKLPVGNYQIKISANGDDILGKPVYHAESWVNLIVRDPNHIVGDSDDPWIPTIPYIPCGHYLTTNVNSSVFEQNNKSINEDPLPRPL